jgi:quinoprotein glucose dehydrogenase
LKQYEAWRLPQDHLTPFREALVGGDAQRGKKVFYENASIACVRCHRIGNDGGGNAGPELTAVGSRQQREYLLESIVLPNKQIAPGFETTVITTKTGALYSGIVKGETETEVTLLSADEGELKLKKSDIKQREKGLSGMPEGIPDLINRFDLRDLVEFLATQK